jgi:TPR repeat protein
VDQSEIEIAQYLAWKGHKEAEAQLAFCYYYGEGVAQDYREAAKLFQSAAQKGMPEAQAMFGKMCLLGQGVALDRATGLDWLRLAAAQNLVDAQLQLGQAYSEDHEYAEAMRFWNAAAELGDAKAQYNLGLCYASGKVATPDYETAYVWFSLAGDQDHKVSTWALSAKDEAAKMLTKEQLVKAQASLTKKAKKISARVEASEK